MLGKLPAISCVVVGPCSVCVSVLSVCGHQSTPVCAGLVHIGAGIFPTRWGPSVLGATSVEDARGSPTRLGPIPLLVI